VSTAAITAAHRVSTTVSKTVSTMILETSGAVIIVGKSTMTCITQHKRLGGLSMTSTPVASLIEVRDYLGMNSADFGKEWKRLSDDDRQDIRERVAKELEE